MGIYIFGASGSGTTTLGKEISSRLNYSHFDSDNYFWLPSDPPYQNIRPRKERQQLLRNDIMQSEDWVISGCFTGWGDILIPFLDLVIYLWVPTDIRIKRLKERERKEFGVEALSPGGKMYENHKGFLEWASKYDNGGLDMRSKLTHELWLSKIDCSVLRIEGNISLPTSINLVFEKLKGIMY